MFQSPKVQWMSDGSVHLPAVIRFEIYEHCRRSQLEHESKILEGQKLVLKRAQDRKRTAFQKTLLLRKIEEELQTQSRVIVFADFEKDTHAQVFTRCLSPIPRLALQAQATSLEAQEWKAIRWIWSSSNTSTAPTQTPLSRLHPSVVESTMHLGVPSPNLMAAALDWSLVLLVVGCGDQKRAEQAAKWGNRKLTHLAASFSSSMQRTSLSLSDAVRQVVAYGPPTKRTMV